MNNIQLTDSRFSRGGHIKKAGTLSILREPSGQGGTAINKSCLYAQCPEALRHTKQDCPSAVKNCPDFSLKDELPFCPGYYSSQWHYKDMKICLTSQETGSISDIYT